MNQAIGKSLLDVLVQQIPSALVGADDRSRIGILVILNSTSDILWGAGKGDRHSSGVVDYLRSLYGAAGLICLYGLETPSDRSELGFGGGDRRHAVAEYPGRRLGGFIRSFGLDGGGCLRHGDRDHR